MILEELLGVRVDGDTGEEWPGVPGLLPGNVVSQPIDFPVCQLMRDSASIVMARTERG